MSTEHGDTIQTKRKKWIVSVDKDFIMNTSLSGNARWLYIILDSFSSPASPAPFPGIALLCRITKWSEETYRKYRKELEINGWLRVERRRDAQMKFERNLYHLLDGIPDIENPSPKISRTENSRHGKNPSRENSATKSTHVLKERAGALSQKSTKCENPGGGERAPGGAASSPSQVSSPAAKDSARSKATEFVKEWKHWYQRFWNQTQLLDAKQERAVREFFETNPEISHQEVMAITLKAWRHAVYAKGDDTHYFISVNHSKVISSLVNNLTKLTVEVGWKRDDIEHRIQVEYERAEEHISQRS